MGHRDVERALPSPESIPRPCELVRVLESAREVPLEKRSSPVLERELVEQGLVVEGRRLLSVHRGFLESNRSSLQYPAMERPRAWTRYAADAARNFHRDGCFDRAAVIAYFALLSFLPLAVVLVAVGALLLGSLDAAERGTELLLRNVLYALPPQVMTQVRFLQEGIWSGLFYLPIAIWSASTVFNKIEAALDLVFEVEQPRHWALRKLLAFGVVALVSVLLVATMVFGGLLATVERLHRGERLRRASRGPALPHGKRIREPVRRSLGNRRLVFLPHLLDRTRPEGACARGVHGCFRRRDALGWAEDGLHLVRQPLRDLYPNLRRSGDGDHFSPLGARLRGALALGRRACGRAFGTARIGGSARVGMTNGENDFAFARHPQRLPGEALHHQGVASQSVDLRRQPVVLRLEALRPHEEAARAPLAPSAGRGYRARRRAS